MTQGWMTTLQNPATLISIVVGFGLLVIIILFLYLRGSGKSSSDTSSLFAVSDTTEPSTPESGTSTGTLVASAITNSSAAVSTSKSQAKYSGMIFTEDGIKFKPIKEKLLSLIYCDPSMPKSGMKFLAVEKEDGTHVGYDPRDVPVSSEDTPQRAWRATHVYDIVRAVYAAPVGFMEHLNMLFSWIFCGSLVFVSIIALSKL